MDSAEYSLFPFRVDEVFIVEELKVRIKELLQLRGVSSVDVRRIGTVLFALEKTSESTPGVAMVLSLGRSSNNESCFSNLYISEAEFSLSSGGNTYDPAVGSDSYSSTAFELGTNGLREGYGESEAVAGWFSQFDTLLGLDASIKIEYLGDDDQVDWADRGFEWFWDESEEDD